MRGLDGDQVRLGHANAARQTSARHGVNLERRRVLEVPLRQEGVGEGRAVHAQQVASVRTLQTDTGRGLDAQLFLLLPAMEKGKGRERKETKGMGKRRRAMEWGQWHGGQGGKGHGGSGQEARDGR